MGEKNRWVKASSFSTNNRTYFKDTVFFFSETLEALLINPRCWTLMKQQPQFISKTFLVVKCIKHWKQLSIVNFHFVSICRPWNLETICNVIFRPPQIHFTEYPEKWTVAEWIQTVEEEAQLKHEIIQEGKHMKVLGK